MRKNLALVAAGTALLAGLTLSSAGVASASNDPGGCGWYSTNEPVLRKGSQGPSVQALQCQLNAALTDPDIAIDGVFGQLTYNAVVKFQGCAHLDPDGVVGPRTWGNLNFYSFEGAYAC
ncbi:peptidoglycan-binding domain-containing protein [Streptomyces sp. NPDC089919]|uniref:peptidoglycan-binding domain-containing protein n=1 Tax=Streptomyces sp. NPDC089919 TaxID=3155188 RepID=UPI00343C76AB